jgi:hypothetical protein
MMHTPTGKYVGLEEVLAVPTPEPTKTYTPVAYGDFINLIKEKAAAAGMVIESEGYGLSHGGNQMFGVMRTRTDSEEHSLNIGVRSSHDYTLSAAIAAGMLGVFVCDNLCISGDTCTLMRKHTKNVWLDLELHIDQALGSAEKNFNLMVREMDAMKAVPVAVDRGFELIGLAQGHKVLKPQQATVAMKDWKEPRHLEFTDRNLHSLYQCFTEGLKKGPAGSIMDRHTEAHAWFRPMFALA